MGKRITPDWSRLRARICELVMPADIEEQMPKIFCDWLASNAPSPEERVTVVRALIEAQKRYCQSWPSRRSLCENGIFMALDLLTFILQPEAGTMRHPTVLHNLLLNEGLKCLPATLRS